MLTRTEFELAKFCTEEKLKKRTSDRLIAMIKTRAFVIEDIRADSIREIEKIISDSCRSKITELDHCSEDRPRACLGGISCIPRWLVGKNESYLRTTLRSVLHFIFPA